MNSKQMMIVLGAMLETMSDADLAKSITAIQSARRHNAQDRRELSAMIAERDARELPRPFSNARYHQNAEKAASGSTPCVLCGKGVAPGRVKVSVMVDQARNRIVRPETAARESGAWPIGSECLRKYPALKAYAIGERLACDYCPETVALSQATALGWYVGDGCALCASCSAIDESN